MIWDILGNILWFIAWFSVGWGFRVKVLNPWLARDKTPQVKRSRPDYDKIRELEHELYPDIIHDKCSACSMLNLARVMFEPRPIKTKLDPNKSYEIEYLKQLLDGGFISVDEYDIRVSNQIRWGE